MKSLTYICITTTTDQKRAIFLFCETVLSHRKASHLYMMWGSPAKLSLSCCAVWLTVRWSPPDGDAALSHTAGSFATFGFEILPRPESHDKPEA